MLGKSDSTAGSIHLGTSETIWGKFLRRRMTLYGVSTSLAVTGTSGI